MFVSDRKLKEINRPDLDINFKLNVKSTRIRPSVLVEVDFESVIMLYLAQSNFKTKSTKSVNFLHFYHNFPSSALIKSWSRYLHVWYERVPKYYGTFFFPKTVCHHRISLYVHAHVVGLNISSSYAMKHTFLSPCILKIYSR